MMRGGTPRVYSDREDVAQYLSLPLSGSTDAVSPSNTWHVSCNQRVIGLRCAATVSVGGCARLRSKTHKLLHLGTT